MQSRKFKMYFQSKTFTDLWIKIICSHLTTCGLTVSVSNKVLKRVSVQMDTPSKLNKTVHPPYKKIFADGRCYRPEISEDRQRP